MIFGNPPEARVIVLIAGFETVIEASAKDRVKNSSISFSLIFSISMILEDPVNRRMVQDHRPPLFLDPTQHQQERDRVGGEGVLFDQA
jgi:hypothetical protein